MMLYLKHGILLPVGLYLLELDKISYCLTLNLGKDLLELL